jgi:hypothetical protein
MTFMKSRVLFIPLLFICGICSAQKISFPDLKGVWLEIGEKDTTYYNFLSDSNLEMVTNNVKSQVLYKLEILQNEQVLAIGLDFDDASHIDKVLIRMKNRNKIALQDFRFSKSNSWERETDYNTVYLLKKKED